MAAETSFVLRNDFAELGEAAAKTTAFLEEHEAGPGIVFAANLAVEELVTNTIKYGYDDREPHEISVRLRLEDGRLVLEIDDDGRAFNPFDAPEPDTESPVEERQIGGLGIHFVRNLLDTWTYERRGGRNVVTLGKSLNGA